MAHTKDNFGYPVDPELRRLEAYLGILAAGWRSTGDEDALKEYHATMTRLYESGWDDYLDTESLLPSDLMPPEYVKRKRS